MADMNVTAASVFNYLTNGANTCINDSCRSSYLDIKIELASRRGTYGETAKEIAICKACGCTWESELLPTMIVKVLDGKVPVPKLTNLVTGHQMSSYAHNSNTRILMRNCRRLLEFMENPTVFPQKEKAEVLANIARCLPKEIN